MFWQSLTIGRSNWNIIKKFENHPSVLSINENINIEQSFTFSEITSEEVLSEINNLDSKKVESYTKYTNQNIERNFWNKQWILS